MDVGARDVDGDGKPVVHARRQRPPLAEIHEPLLIPSERKKKKKEKRKKYARTHA